MSDAIPLRIPVTSVPAVIAAGAVVVATGVAGLTVSRPVTVLAVLAAAAVVSAMMLRVEWAALAFVAIEPFEGMLKTVNGSIVKIVGALLFAAWLLRLAGRARRVALAHGVVYAAAALFAVLLAATALHPNGSAGLSVLTRYLSYLAALVVLVDTMRTTLPPRRVATVFVASCSASAVVGLIDYLTSNSGRAGGPLSDPNDFAFMLITAIPLSLGLWRYAARARALYPLAATVLTVATVATFSRGALLGLAVMACFAAATGQVRAKAAGIVLAVVLALGAGAWLAAPQTVSRSLMDKQTVAQQNVEDRYTTWTMAGEMTADHPVLGLGPGGFGADFDRYRPAGSAQTPNLDVAHEMYLEVSSELGLLGLAAFAGLLGLGFAGARRRAVDGTAESAFAAAVCTSFAGVLVAAAFLTEQYYLPIWLLAAFGAALDPGRRIAARAPTLARRGG